MSVGGAYISIIGLRIVSVASVVRGVSCGGMLEHRK